MVADPSAAGQRVLYRRRGAGRAPIPPAGSRTTAGFRADSTAAAARPQRHVSWWVWAGLPAHRFRTWEPVA